MPDPAAANPTNAPPPKSAATPPRAIPWPWIVTGLILVATMIALRVEGRVWWCACRQFRPWISDVWTSHCSQHLFDPYSITHMSHGLIFYAVLLWLVPRWPIGWRLAIAVAIAAAWEILENSPIIINRYRSVTMSLDYLGDSVVNAIGDVLSCAIGFFIARAIGVRWSLALFVATELILLWLIRDNLTLNVIMLIYPLDSIKAWQSVGH